MKKFYLILAAIAAVAMSAQAVTPANPVADDWYDCGDESGFSKFYFTLPTTDVNGNTLNPENLSYAVWVNDGFGEVYQFTFPATDYTFDLYYDIDEVPYWLYSAAVDFRNYFVYMYRTNENDNPLFVRDDDHDGNIGIQVFYTEDGVREASEIGWLYEVETPEPPEPPTPPTPEEDMIPANPTADSWYDCGGEYGYTRFYFTLPTKDVEGNSLNPQYLSYAVWINDGNGEVYQFTFAADDYMWDLYEDINEVPYDIYSTGIDFHSNYVYFYRTNENDNPLFVRDEEHNGNIGIQVFYTVDRAKNASDIVWLYEEETPEPPEPPTPAEGVQLVIVDQDGAEHVFDLTQGDDGDFSTTVTLDYVPYGQFYWDPNLTYAENDANRPAVPFYFLIDGQRYGAEGMRETVLGFAMQNPLDSELDGFYTVPVGFSYTLGVAFKDGVYYVYAAVSTPTAVNELNANKTVAGVRYFNLAGQEMAQPSGVTIQVTTYTDGTTSAVKVMK